MHVLQLPPLTYKPISHDSVGNSFHYPLYTLAVSLIMGENYENYPYLHSFARTINRCGRGYVNKIC